MQVEDLKSAEHAASGRVSSDNSGLAVEAYILSSTQRFESVGYGERQCGEGLSVYACLGIGQQEANEDPICRMLTSRLSKRRLEIDGAIGNARLIQGAVEGSGI